LRVLLAEKAKYVGGATTLSGGGTWIAANSIARAQSIKGSAEAARAYIENVIGPTLQKM